MNPNTFLSGDFLHQLEKLSVLAKKPVSGHLRGQHRSKRTGSGMIFSDYRPYVEGDDTRDLDWGIYLRLDRLILRLFEEEADLPVYIFLDISQSMKFGHPNKLEFAQKFSAALAYVSLMNHDRVSLVTYAEDVVSVVPARRGNKQLWRTMHVLDQVSAGGRTDLRTSLCHYFGAKRSRGLVVVVSDFLEDSSLDSTFKVLSNLRHEVFAIHVSSPDEYNPKLGDDVLLVDSEGLEVLDAQVTPQLVDQYKKEFDTFGNYLEGFFKRFGWGYLRADSNVSLESLFFTILREKGFFR